MTQSLAPPLTGDLSDPAEAVPPMHLPRLPALPARAIAFMPLAPLSVALSRFAQRLATRHPSMIRRLGVHARARFVLEPDDLPVVMTLEPRGGRPLVHLSRRALTGDARIRGPLSALLGLVHGAYDGDALFFSRDLAIEGDTAAVLALRNAIDDAELDLAAEAALLAGPLGASLTRLIAVAERRTGVALSRREEEETVSW